ncbi:MAG: hypothetical protein KAH44_13525, partial [Oricola sp.]|nr:hypothetical protein [Oricola sp.]
MLDRLLGRKQGQAKNSPEAPPPAKPIDKIETDEDRDRFIAQQLSTGMSLSDVQKLLANEHGITLTYFDLRLIAADLDVDWQKIEANKPKKKENKAADLSQPPASASGTSITVHKVVSPGASMSGEVTFGSGAKAEWLVDNLGRLSLTQKPGAEKPN